MPTVKNVGEPCAGEPHARFEVAAGGNQASRASTCRAAQAPLADPTRRPSRRRLCNNLPRLRLCARRRVHSPPMAFPMGNSAVLVPKSRSIQAHPSGSVAGRSAAQRNIDGERPVNPGCGGCAGSALTSRKSAVRARHRPWMMSRMTGRAAFLCSGLRLPGATMMPGERVPDSSARPAVRMKRTQAARRLPSQVRRLAEGARGIAFVAKRSLDEPPR
jgi:hypothetical protein